MFGFIQFLQTIPPTQYLRSPSWLKASQMKAKPILPEVQEGFIGTCSLREARLKREPTLSSFAPRTNRTWTKRCVLDLMGIPVILTKAEVETISIFCGSTTTRGRGQSSSSARFCGRSTETCFQAGYARPHGEGEQKHEQPREQLVRLRDENLLWIIFQCSISTIFRVRRLFAGRSDVWLSVFGWYHQPVDERYMRVTRGLSYKASISYAVFRLWCWVFGLPAKV